MAPFLNRAQQFADRTAIIDAEGAHSFGALLTASGQVAACLLDGAVDLRGRRLALLVLPGFRHVAALLGIWRAGGIAVPLCPTHPRPELEFVLADSGADTAIVSGEFMTAMAPIARGLSLRLLTTEAMITSGFCLSAERSPDDRAALILYTSGTTSKPKGVLTTHDGLQAQIESLTTAWEWSSADRILHTLPLHHVHGLVNALCCALWSGAACEFLSFDARTVWQRFVGGGHTLFMAVPTMYVKLIAAWEAATRDEQQQWSVGASQFRLMVSGSSALPVRVLERWHELTGHILLERYGMTEIGMALSNPLHCVRSPGLVGTPLPSVEVRLVDDAGHPVGTEEPGQLEVRGPTVFREYWNCPDATREAFRADGWFRTGDVAQLEPGGYRLLGRQSVDIIKTGGYKVSALEIEAVLRLHPQINDCAVVGVPDEQWGECVGAAVVPGERAVELDELRGWARAHLSPYKLPTRLICVAELPRNVMGKVVKPQVARLFIA